MSAWDRDGNFARRDVLKFPGEWNFDRADPRRPVGEEVSARHVKRTLPTRPSTRAWASATCASRTSPVWPTLMDAASWRLSGRTFSFMKASRSGISFIAVELGHVHRSSQWSLATMPPGLLDRHHDAASRRCTIMLNTLEDYPTVCRHGSIATASP